MKRREADRRPVRRQHLDVRDLGQPVRRERERDGGDERRVVPARQGVGEEVRAERAQKEGRDERDVMADERLPVSAMSGAAIGTRPSKCSENARTPVAG